MHPLRKIVLTRAMAILLISVALWQQQNAKAGADEIPTLQPWQAPLSAPLQLINPYFQPSSDYSAGHRGVDYRVKVGEPVFAPTDSTVWFSGKVVDRQVLSLKTRAGDLLEFEPVCSTLIAGTDVVAGQPVAATCQPDASYRQHCADQLCLHFSLRTLNGYLSPLVRYGNLAPTVLLPTD